MRLSEWRARAPHKEAMTPKVLAVVEAVMTTLGADDDPTCWIVWGDDPGVRYVVLAPTDAEGDDMAAFALELFARVDGRSFTTRVAKGTRSAKAGATRPGAAKPGAPGAGAVKSGASKARAAKAAARRPAAAATTSASRRLRT
jgi:hypothetical protein